MGLLMSQEDKNARDRVRKMIEDTHVLAIETKGGIRLMEEKLSRHEHDFTKHQKDEETIFNRVFKKIESLKCPQEATVKAHEQTMDALRNHNKEQNGHLRELAEKSAEIQKQATDTQKTIAELIAGQNGVAMARDVRRNNIMMIIAIVSCMFVGIGIFLKSFSSMQDKVTTRDILNAVKEIEINNGLKK